jgi:Kef-type K+ transport system membrane component KefB
MIFVVKPLVRKVEVLYLKHNKLPLNSVSSILLLATSSAWVTEMLGLHTIFGAFIAGAVIPRHQPLRRDLTQNLEPLVVTFLLPFFFASTGLKLNLLLLGGKGIWMYCALITLIAIVGKLGGSMFAARLMGMSWREAGALGTLLNTRGLMEIIILNIGLDLGIIPPSLYSILITMALVTTCMTGPLLEWIYPPQQLCHESMSKAARE